MTLKTIRNELNHRAAHLISVLLVPLIVPSYILAQSALAALTEVPKATAFIFPILKGIPESLKIAFSPRRTL